MTRQTGESFFLRPKVNDVYDYMNIFRGDVINLTATCELDMMSRYVNQTTATSYAKGDVWCRFS